MKARGKTGKGCYKEYWFVPKWFVKRLDNSNGGLFSAADCAYYVGFGFNKKTKDWYRGAFLTRLEMALDYWKREAERADFIIHLREDL
jgi:hypothetical protein